MFELMRTFCKFRRAIAGYYQHLSARSLVRLKEDKCPEPVDLQMSAENKDAACADMFAKFTGESFLARTGCAEACSLELAALSYDLCIIVVYA